MEIKSFAQAVGRVGAQCGEWTRLIFSLIHMPRLSGYPCAGRDVRVVEAEGCGEFEPFAMDERVFIGDAERPHAQVGLYPIADLHDHVATYHPRVRAGPGRVAP